MARVSAWGLALASLGVTLLGLALGGVGRKLSRPGRRWPPFAPLALLAIPLGLALYELEMGGMFSGLAAALYAILALCGLLGWGASWGLW